MNNIDNGSRITNQSNMMVSKIFKALFINKYDIRERDIQGTKKEVNRNS